MNYSVFSKALSGIALATVALASLPAAASPYSSMVVFGDSLSDNGNDAILLGGSIIGGSTVQNINNNTYIPSAPYLTATSIGTFSNGPVWASDAASALGVKLTPALAGGTNFAFGGATTGGPGPIPNLLTQAGLYLTSTGGKASSSALYVVEGGGNDARAALSTITSSSTPATIAATFSLTAASFASNIFSIVNALNAAGAQHIVVWDAPNLGLAPAVVAGGGAALGTLLAEQMNADLATLLAGQTDVLAAETIRTKMAECLG